MLRLQPSSSACSCCYLLNCSLRLLFVSFVIGCLVLHPCIYHDNSIAMSEALHDVPVRGAETEDGELGTMPASSSLTLGTSSESPSSTPVAVAEVAAASDKTKLVSRI